GGEVAGGLHLGQDHELAHVADQHRANAQAAGVPHVLYAVDELVGSAQRGPQHAAGATRRLHAGVPVRARPDEETDFHAPPAAERDHALDLLVGLEHDPAALTDAVDRDLEG